MSDSSGHAPANVVVVGWRGDEVAERALCESEDEAVALAAEWAERDFSSVEIQDLSTSHGPDEILEPGVEIEPGGADDRDR